MDDLRRVHADLGVTTLSNLHFLDLAKVYGQRILGLRSGKLVYDAAGSAVRDVDFAEIYGRSVGRDDVTRPDSAQHPQ